MPEWERQEGTSHVETALATRPVGDDPAAWQPYWQTQGQPWRREPEISAERQAYLAARRAIQPNLVEGVYPFKGIEPKLTRADIEWLLATHASQGVTGPLDPGKVPYIRWQDATNPTKSANQPDDLSLRIGLDLRGADLRDLDLSGLPLSGLRAGLYFSEASDNGITYDKVKAADEGAITLLQGANLRGATIERAVLSHAKCDGCDLTGASLQETRCESVTFDGATLTQAKLTSANFEHASLVNVRLGGAVCDGCEFRSATLDGAQAQNASLVKASFYGNTLRNVRFDGADLSGATLGSVVVEGGSLAGARLDDANMKTARLDGAQLEGASMRRVNLQSATDGLGRQFASLRGANLRKVTLHEAVLEGTNCAGADLTGADLTRARLVDVQFERATLDGAHLVEAQLTNVDLSDASLKGVDLRRAICDPRTSFDGARFGRERADAPRLVGVRWNGADLSGVEWSDLRRLGDEREARRVTLADGQRKSRDQRLTELDEAVRANRQLALALAGQGLEDAELFAYRAQTLQRWLLWRHLLWRGGPRALGAYLFSALLAALTGYGYRMGRLLVAYALLVSLGAVAYVLVGARTGEPLHWPDAYLVSVTAFHGRVFFEGFRPASPLSWVAAVEGVTGVVIEGVFVAMLTQRFFGK